jgi:hypothetical protein
MTGSAIVVIHEPVGSMAIWRTTAGDVVNACL